MAKRTTSMHLWVAVIVIFSGCQNGFLSFGPPDMSALRVILVNRSATQFVSPNVGVCSQGLANPPHNFLEQPPVLAPGQSVAYTTRQIAGDDGVCGDPEVCSQFMVGLCGWSHGPSEESMTRSEQRYGGQIGMMFQCGDTVVLSWTDEGAEGGTWTSQVQTAPGNDPPAAEFQFIEDSGGAVCTE